MDGDSVALDEHGATAVVPMSADAGSIIWRKSSWSAYNGACVEVAEFGAAYIGVRDSKAGENGSVLVFSRADWAGFVAQLKAPLAR
jgi:hypothetical protein